jgi:hypothetical protein
LGSFTPAAFKGLFHVIQESDATAHGALVITNHTADVAKGVANYSILTEGVSDTGLAQICGGAGATDANNLYSCMTWNTSSGFVASFANPGGPVGPASAVVPFSVEGSNTQTADIFDILNSSLAVLTGFGAGGQIKFTEAVAPSGASNVDVLYGDSTAHCIKASLNNGSFICLAQVTAVPLTVGSGTGNVFVAPNGYFICTAACTVTPPLPTAGVKFCIQNDVNTTGVITLGALGGSGAYGNQANTAYGTAGTGTLSSGGAATDSVCIEGRDTTKYVITYHVGTWMAS